MNLRSDKRIKRMKENVEAARIHAWIKGESRVSALPWLLYLSPTNYCNLRCAVCARADYIEGAKGFMSVETLDALLKKLPDSFTKIYLQKQGEPLLNPDIIELARKVRTRFPKAEIAMHTNGIRMTKALAEGLAPSLDFVAFSISAISKDTYKACHGLARLDEALDGLRVFLDVKAKLPERKPTVAIDYVEQEGNQNESSEAVADFFRGFKGLNSVDFHWAYNFQGLIEQARLDAYDIVPEPDFPRCVFPYSSFTLLHDGRVSYCFVEARENATMGNLLDEEFGTIWNGERYRAFRQAMAKGRFSWMEKERAYGCRQCSWLWSPQSQQPELLGVDIADEAFLQDARTPAGVADLLDLGLRRLIKGKLHEALGYLVRAEKMAGEEKMNETLLGDIVHWREITEAGLRLAWPRADWTDALRRSGRAPADLQAKYVKFN